MYELFPYSKKIIKNKKSNIKCNFHVTFNHKTCHQFLYDISYFFRESDCKEDTCEITL